jgi:hypothetical protein
MRRKATASSDPAAPGFEGEAPTDAAVTAYDIAHATLYIRLMDAAAEGLDWRVMTIRLFEIEPDREPDRARRIVESHLARALWMRDEGYKGLLGARPSN